MTTTRKYSAVEGLSTEQLIDILANNFRERLRKERDRHEPYGHGLDIVMHAARELGSKELIDISFRHHLITRICGHNSERFFRELESILAGIYKSSPSKKHLKNYKSYHPTP